MTREETEISLWVRVYHDREHMGPTTAKEHADEALRAFREAFPNEPREYVNLNGFMVAK